MIAERAGRAAFFLLAAFYFYANPAGAAEWRKEIFDPQPAADDVVLPLPCGGKIAFRRVNVGATDNSDPTAPLFDKELSMGRQAENDRSFMEGKRPEYISGSLDQTDGSRFFLIGKYEVTAAQYRAVLADDDASCPKRFGPPDALPGANLSWYDAIEFTRRFNAWLYANAPMLQEALRSTRLADPFMRLPTEVEWEFAARGGLKVTDAQRGDARFPMPEGMDLYTWSNSPQSAQGKPKPIGTRNANPLGLYDIYGNAAELIQEPFRLTRGSRLHGEVGGFVVKGGSFLDDPSIINSALRDEYPYFSKTGDGGEFRARTIGMRVVLGSSILNQEANIDKLAQASEAVSRQAEAAIAPNATSQLAELERKARGTAIGDNIQDVRNQLGNELVSRSALERDLISSLLLNNAMLAREMTLTSKLLDVFFDFMTDTTFPAEQREGYKAKFEDNRRNLDTYTSLFAESTQKIARNYLLQVRGLSVPLAKELAERGDQTLAEFLPVALEGIEDFADGRFVETHEIMTRVIGQGHKWL